MCMSLSLLLFFFFNDTATTEIYTLSLHDALPICERRHRKEVVVRTDRPDDLVELGLDGARVGARIVRLERIVGRTDRKSTRLNSSHSQISYAVFCLKKKKKKENNIRQQYRTNGHK